MVLSGLTWVMMLYERNKRIVSSNFNSVPLGSVHKYFGGGAGQNGGGARKVLSCQKGGDQKVFRSKRGGVKKVWSN